MLSRIGLFTAFLALFAAIRPVHAVIGGYVKTSGRDFILDGCKRYFSGTNIYYLSVAVLESNRARMDNGLNVAAAHNLDVLRAWAFCESCSTPYISFSNGVMTVNSLALESLDYVLAGASQRNIRLILTLTNNWADYGGMDVYTSALGGTYHDDFYTNSKIKAAFKQYINAIVTRINHETGIAYKDDPTIFAWELANEPRCGASSTQLPKSSSCDWTTIAAWTDEMSKYIKSLDSNHLVTTGEEGFGLPASQGTPGNDYVYRYDEGTNFTATMSLSAIDFGNFHLYPLGWGLTNIPDEGSQWIKAHSDIGIKLNKPVVLEEFGLEQRSNDTNNYPDWYQASVDSGVAAVLFWMAAGSDYPDNSGYQLYDSDITTIIDPNTAKLVAKNGCCTVGTNKSVNTTITDTTIYAVSGCGAEWAQCGGSSSYTGSTCCYHGLDCVDFGTGYSQCQKHNATYRYATTPVAVTITTSTCTGTIVASTSTASSSRTTTTTTTTTSAARSSSTTTTTARSSSTATTTSPTTSRTTTTTTASTTSRTTTTTTSPTTSRTTTTSSSSSSASPTCASKWGQCGGYSGVYTGPTCCIDSTCTYNNAYYSQCL